MTNVFWLFGAATVVAATSAWFITRYTNVDLPANKQKPALLISSTFHSRFKPILHSFRYPVLYICVDLDSIGYVDSLFSTTRKAWRILSLRSEDYLGTQHAGSIKEKLFCHLRNHNVETSALGKALLVTTPRLFGYSFNPVSFHYIYDKQDVLRIVVLEVNNTFGEKHVYVLDQEDATDRVREGYTSAQTFRRRFHVSPFNDRSGSYQLQCADPLGTSQLRVDMHLTLLEPDGTKKLTAQVNSTQSAILTTSTLACLWAIVKHGTAVFLTMPRILRQAYTLHYAKKLSVYMRPEPYEEIGAIGRQSMSSTDRYFMDLWIEYLQSNVEWFPCAQIIINILPTAEQVVIDADGEGILQLTILSTTFFDSLATSESALTLLWTESLSLECPVFRASDPLLFLKVFNAGFGGTLPGRYYLQSHRVKYRGRPTWFNEAITQVVPQYAEFLSMTNRGLDNFAYDMALKGKISKWGYRWTMVSTLIMGHLGNAIFSALATFIETTGPQDEWVRVKAALDRLESEKKSG